MKSILLITGQTNFCDVFINSHKSFTSLLKAEIIDIWVAAFLGNNLGIKALFVDAKILDFWVVEDLRDFRKSTMGK